MNLFYNDTLGAPHYTWNGLGYKASMFLFNETPNRVNTSGNEVISIPGVATTKDTINVMIQAGKSTDGNLLNILVSNYHSDYSQIQVAINNLNWPVTDSITITQNTIQGPSTQYVTTVSAVKSANSLTLNLNNATAPSVYLLQLNRKNVVPVTGVSKSNELNDKLKLSPNPVLDRLKVSFSSEKEQDAKLSIYNGSYFNSRPEKFRIQGRFSKKFVQAMAVITLFQKGMP